MEASERPQTGSSNWGCWSLAQLYAHEAEVLEDPTPGLSMRVIEIFIFLISSEMGWPCHPWLSRSSAESPLEAHVTFIPSLVHSVDIYWAFSTEVKSPDSRNQSVLDFQPHYFLALWPWASHSTPVSFSFSIYQTGRIITNLPTGQLEGGSCAWKSSAQDVGQMMVNKWKVLVWLLLNKTDTLPAFRELRVTLTSSPGAASQGHLTVCSWVGSGDTSLAHSCYGDQSLPTDSCRTPSADPNVKAATSSFSPSTMNVLKLVGGCYILLSVLFP